MRLTAITGIASAKKKTMKLPGASYRRNFMLIYLTMSILFSLTMVSVPVKAQEEVRVYVKMPNGYIPGVPVNNFFNVELWIESPPEWTNTSDGIIGWSLYVNANASVLYPAFVTAAQAGYWLYDFLFSYGYFSYLPPHLLVDNIDTTSGTFEDVTEFIAGWETLGVGAGGSGRLCNLTYQSLSETDYTLIDLFNVYYYTPAGMFVADVVLDGHYNSPPVYYNLTVESTPIDGVNFTVDSGEYVTNATVELEEGSHTVTMPDPWMNGTDQYNFVEWEDQTTNPIRSISLTSNLTITATYELAKKYLLTVNSHPITGIDFSVDGVTHTTNWSDLLFEGDYTITIPSIWMVGSDQYDFMKWEDDSTNPVRSIFLTSNMTIMATYELKLFPPMASFTFSPTEPIVNETVTFDASASNDYDGTVVSYEWDFGDGATTNETDPVTTYAYANAGIYTVTLMVTDNDGLTDTASKSITIRKLSSSISITASPTTMKFGENTIISGSITPTRASATITLWHRLSGEEIWSTLVILMTDLNGQYSYAWTPTVAGTFELKASWSGDANTLPAESSVITITVVPLLPPVASFTWEPETPYVGDSVVFDASASYDLDGVIVSYNWDFGDATTSNTTESFIEHTYNETNTYTVALTVIDNDGVTSTATAHITVIHRMLSVELSGEFDYLLRESVRIKIAALVTDVTTTEPVSTVDVNIQIYDDNNDLWVSSVMTESPAGAGIYVWASSGTIKELRLTKGIYLVRVAASFRDGPTAYDILLFHIDPPAEGTNETLYYIALIGIVLATANGLIFKRKQIIKRFRRLMRTYVNVLTFD